MNDEIICKIGYNVFKDVKLMNAREKYNYWLEAAQYDLVSARVMMNGGRYMYVAFMSQQAVEKITKGIYTLYTDTYIMSIKKVHICTYFILATLSLTYFFVSS